MSETSTNETVGETPTDAARIARMNAAREAKKVEGRLEVLDPIEKAVRNPTSRKLAIAAKCWDCVGAGADPNPRREIRECPITKCGLWPVRPYQPKD